MMPKPSFLWDGGQASKSCPQNPCAMATCLVAIEVPHRQPGKGLWLNLDLHSKMKADCGPISCDIFTEWNMLARSVTPDHLPMLFRMFFIKGVIYDRGVLMKGKALFKPLQSIINLQSLVESVSTGHNGERNGEMVGTSSLTASAMTDVILQCLAIAITVV